MSNWTFERTVKKMAVLFYFLIGFTVPVVFSFNV